MEAELRRELEDRICRVASTFYGARALINPNEMEVRDGNSSLHEVYIALEVLARGGNNAGEFRGIVRRLTMTDLERLDYLFVMAVMLNLVRADSSSRESDRDWTFKAAKKIVVLVCGQIAVEKAKILLGIPDPFGKPYTDAATAIGLVTGVAGMFLLSKNPWLSKALIKVGVGAMLASVLYPVGVNLDPPMAAAFGVWALFIFALICKEA